MHLNQFPRKWKLKKDRPVFRSTFHPTTILFQRINMNIILQLFKQTNPQISPHTTLFKESKKKLHRLLLHIENYRAHLTFNEMTLRHVFMASQFYQILTDL